MPEHRRITDTLEEYWNKLRGSRSFPLEGEIEPGKLKDIWDSCFLVKVEDFDRDHYKYTYMGQELINAYGDDLSAEEVNVLVAPNKKRMLEKVKEVILSGAPVADESEFVNAKSVTVKYRQIFLPLGEDERVEYVLGGMRWRGF